MTVQEVIFLLVNLQKKSAWINIFVLDLVLQGLFFCLQMWKDLADSKKAKRLSKEEIKKQLLDSMIIDVVVEFENLNKEAEKTQDPETVVEIIKWYEDIIETKNKGIINIAYHQGQVFKRLKQKEKFAKLVSELGIHETTIIFKINVFKLRKKYHKLLTFSIGIRFFKD